MHTLQDGRWVDACNIRFPDNAFYTPFTGTGNTGVTENTESDLYIFVFAQRLCIVIKHYLYYGRRPTIFTSACGKI